MKTDILKEEWKRVQYNDIHPNYELFISNRGRIKYNDEIRNSKIGSNGYYRTFYININEKYSTIEVHRLVYSTFYGKQPKGLDIDHIDHNKLNNDISNIQLLTRSENVIKKNNFLNINDKNQYRIRINGDIIIQTKNEELYKLLYHIKEKMMYIYYGWHDEPILIYSKRNEPLILNKNGLFNINAFLKIKEIILNDGTKMDIGYNYIIDGEYSEKEAGDIIKYIEKINKAINKKDRNYEYRK